MAETRTPRLGLPQWSSGQSDSPSREDFNEAFLNLENRALSGQYGPLNDRPIPEVEGRLWIDQDGVIYRDTGTSWTQIGLPKNSVRIVKTEGTEPAVSIEVPSALGADALRIISDGKQRVRVTNIGDMQSSSVRLYSSDVAAPAANLPHTIGLTTKGANASGVTVYGQNAQTGNLVETKNSVGADLTQLTPTGDVNTLGRVHVGQLTSVDAQLFVQTQGASRPAALFRTPVNSLTNNTAFQIETANASQNVLKVDGTGRLAVGSRNNKSIIIGDNLGLNTNYTGANNGNAPISQGRAVFRNTTNGYGVAGLDIRQEPGDGPSASSMGLFAGQADINGVAPDRVRLGITPSRIGALFPASDPEWRPVVIKGAENQVARLLELQDFEGNPVSGIDQLGNITGRSITVSSTDPNVFPGPVTAGGIVTGTALRALQGSSSSAGVLSEARTDTNLPHFVARDQDAKERFRVNNDGTIEVGKDTSAVPAGAVLMTLRGQQYRQNGRKLQSYDQAAGRWGSFESANSAEYYTQSQQNVKDQWVAINWFGEVNDTESAYGFTSGTSKITVPWTGLYDVRALAHVEMNFTGGGTATFRVNNVNEMKYRRDFARVLGWDVCTLSLNDLLLLNAGDTLEFIVRIDSWLFSTKTLNTGDYRSRLSLRFAGNP
ncbi:hypothetical protein SEA_KABOCHA_59 [Gordonia phage Kabocha]|uniref:Uncharacterized protein n=1 Tax=Gordonia phage Chidiebere TaxID=2656530 RepID=A0A649VLM5_9CAUD|nr:hypothetical protein PQD14_gp058 [Gordonia phage Chidiebere]AZS07912.1 hypothetical protein PBI_GRAY_58 [Gordonia phage Gray]WAA19845.1 hypothetical protein SEA_KABOCHA_59 [Gordonia phage Kabocha]WAA20035.1 hypothetical protein SEA_HANEM_58 [Gordonia phage Hanem]WNM67078.1 hypothetical protein SEA_SCHOMBER_57 [Gordonia Phage Schomber]QGJ92949.1 hypothetical protein PBI_CHIDIEBERE_58 [Gordonia phage Chidiebere]